MHQKLYWFLKEKHAQQFFENGQMYFGHCSRYEDASLTVAQRDSESCRRASFKSTEMRLWSGKSVADAIEVPFTSADFSCELPDYFLRSLSIECRPKMLSDLGAQVVIEFSDVTRFFASIDDALSKQHSTGAWEVTKRQVRYVSKQELLGVYGTTDRMFVKERSAYRAQAEFRITLLPKHNFPAKKASHIFLYLEGVSQFAKLSKRGI